MQSEPDVEDLSDVSVSSGIVCVMIGEMDCTLICNPEYDTVIVLYFADKKKTGRDGNVLRGIT